MSSIKLAVILLFAFAVLLGAATFYESGAGTEEAQRLIYKTLWFDFLLFILGLNVACAALSRFPWRKRQIGFAVTHMGILIILIGAVITRQFGLEGQLTLMEGERADHFLLDDITFSVSIPRLNLHREFDPWFIEKPIPDGKRIEYKAGESGLVCYVNRFFFNPRVVDTVTGDGAEDNPAVYVNLFHRNETTTNMRKWLLVDDPERNSLDLEVAELRFRRAASQEDFQRQLNSNEAESKPNNLVMLFLDPDENIYYWASNAEGQSASGTVNVGEAFDTTWGELQLIIDAFYSKAKVTETIIDERHSAFDPHRPPMAKIRLEYKGDSLDEYVSFNSTQTFNIAGELCNIYFGRRRIPMGFALQLIDFDAKPYPGTNRPSRFQSRVTMIDPGKNVEREELIYMNHPLKYNKYKVYQSSYQLGRNGQPDKSYFTVARAPGTPVIYAGSTILILGMFVMFTTRRWLQRNSS